MTIKIILLLIILSVATSTFVFGQKFTNRTLRNFQRAEKAFEEGNHNRASKLYHGILKRQPHGMSLKRVGDLALMQGDTASAIMNYYSALELMQTELEFYQSNIPGYAGITILEEWAHTTESAIFMIEGIDTVIPASTTSRHKPIGMSTEEASAAEISPTSVLISIDHETEGFMIGGLPFLVKVYANGAKTSFYDYKDNPLAGWNIPDFHNLTEIVRAFANKSNFDRLAESINWEDDDTVVFISTTTIYDEFNTMQFKGYKMEKSFKRLVETTIDPGDFTSVILIK